MGSDDPMVFLFLSPCSIPSVELQITNESWDHPVWEIWGILHWQCGAHYINSMDHQTTIYMCAE